MGRTPASHARMDPPRCSYAMRTNNANKALKAAAQTATKISRPYCASSCLEPSVHSREFSRYLQLSYKNTDVPLFFNLLKITI